MSDSYLGEIRLFPFAYAPRGWAVCAGQQLPISSNVALYSLLGVNYGGNGTSNFNLPNLQGMVAINQGQSQTVNGSSYVVGENGGASNVTLLLNQIPVHYHSFNVNTGEGSQTTSAGLQLSKAAAGRVGQETDAAVYTPNAVNTAMSPTALGHTGGNLAHNNLQPYLAMTYCICLQGDYPPRS